MAYLMRIVEYEKLRRLSVSGTEHSGFLICNTQPQGYPSAGNNLVIASYRTGRGEKLKVTDDPDMIQIIDGFLEQNMANGFFLTQFHTHPVDVTFSREDLQEFARSDYLLGWRPRHLFTPNQVFSARMSNGRYRFDHGDDLPNLIDEGHEAAQVIRNIRSLVRLELDLL
ncbi:MAG: hypothetical protein HY516_02140 [Candidatus Aenigmarchaeota archaeon]|nr:hypothetical protein [Candidatus Aenigmarchaeota archaeon]